MTTQGHPGRRVLGRLAIAGVLAFVCLLLSAGPASAHASLIGTDPAEGQIFDSAPAAATFTFDEPVRLQSGGVRLFDATGREIPTTAKTSDLLLVVDLPSSLDEGTFVVAWRVISADGHPVAGALTFSVGTPSTTVATTVAVARSAPAGVTTALGMAQGLTYLGVFGACGLVLFVTLLLPRDAGVDQIRDRLTAWSGRFVGVVFAAGAALLPLTSLYQRAEGLGALGSAAVWTDSLRGVETLSAVLLAGGTLLATRFAMTAHRVRTDRVIALGAVGLTLLSLGLVGHTRSSTPFALMIAADLSHVLAGSLWFGGLIGLVVSLRRLADRPGTGTVVLARFSLVAAWSLLLVAVTGTVLGWRILGTWENLVGTDFGRLLLVKVALVAVIAALAGWNRFRLLPAVLADGGYAPRAAAADRLRRAVRIEAVLLVGVLGLTGFLVDRTPVEESGSVALPGGFDPTTFTGRNGEVRVLLDLDPLGVGKNAVVFQIQDAEGNPLEPIANPVLTAEDGAIALGEQAVTNVDSGTYTATVVLPTAGTWTFNVSVRVGEFENPVVTVTVPVPGSP